ncbi:MAG: beta-L-arabinofuranosidase domain-containing protein [Pyrinomonadaceae bacterium]
MEANKKRSLPSLLVQLEEHGVVDNFRRLSGRKKVARQGPLYTDSDLYKWMEAAAFVLQSDDDPQIRSSLEKMIDEVVAAQGKDGYLNTYYAKGRAKERFTDFLRGHELYCLGHLLQAGIAYQRATGERRLLEVGIRYADYAISQLGPGKKPAFAGHPEIEMALVELYRTTGERRYLEFANYLLKLEPSGIKTPRPRYHLHF